MFWMFCAPQRKWTYNENITCGAVMFSVRVQMMWNIYSLPPSGQYLPTKFDVTVSSVAAPRMEGDLTV